MLRAAVLVVIAGCGSSKAPTAGPGGEGKCEPGRCLEDLPRVIKPFRQEARACFDEAAKKNPALQGGRLIINLEVAPSGEVTPTQGMQSDQLDDKELVGCVLFVMLKVKFPPGSKVMRGFHTFEFARK